MRCGGRWLDKGGKLGIRLGDYRVIIMVVLLWFSGFRFCIVVVSDIRIGNAMGFIAGIILCTMGYYRGVSR